eukprot:TRINITY_DN7786_c0_g1_i2.p1 TRINITY_DN7786_c0_g1~~TRINITY_DN7786_c0_g1_i2.p1  ORF type:complete len:530 (-),score=144.35 TRINITY_DN7786_c0_g1_i2:80-1450(-)
MKEKNAPFKKIKAISGSGQQHGSVYWKKGAFDKLKQVDSSKPLTEQSQDWFSVKNSPIWMDSSTTLECHELEEFFGGPQRVADVTGSIAYERFTINQIRKISKDHPVEYNDTERISLVSSFMASLLAGSFVGIDFGDASGMNLMDIRKRKWDSKILEWAAPDLASKLGDPIASSTIVGKIHRYFVERYDFDPQCEIVAWTGDNPSSVAGLRLREGDTALSLGTSDTLFGPLSSPHPSDEGHIFCDPVHPQGYMALLCYKNGSLTREDIRNTYADGDWARFNSYLEASKPGNLGNIGFYFKEFEITPKAQPGYHRFDVDGTLQEEFPSKESNVRAVIEGQFLSMWVHSRDIGMKTHRIFATGGASNNRHILQVMSDVFGVPVFVHSQPNSACLGGAYRALHAHIAHGNDATSFDEIMQRGAPFTKAVDPNMDAHAEYNKLAERYKKHEVPLHFVFKK